MSQRACHQFARHAVIPLLLLAGCQQKSEIRQYEVDRDADPVLTSDALRDQFESLPFNWTVPDAWTETENDQFSKMAWKAGSGGAEARITLSDLPAAAGVEPQFMRWQGQVNVPESKAAELLKSVEQLQAGQATGRWIEIKGESETIMGLIVPHRNKLWVFKYRSANSTAEAQRTAFRAFCESLRAG